MIYDIETCAVGRVPPPKRSILPDLASHSRAIMTFLFIASGVCVLAVLLGRPVLAMLGVRSVSDSQG
jgi:hypothetical protein